MPPSVEANIASVDYLGDRLTFVDLPGSVEFAHEARNILPLCDAAIVVCEADERKLPALRVILRELEDLGMPRILFLNKIDQATMRIRETAGHAAADLAHAACCCARFRSGRTASSPASSISRWSAPSSIANTPPPKSWTCPPAKCRARRKPATPCWSGWPIMTTR